MTDVLPNFTHILTAAILRCYARLGRRHCVVTSLSAYPQRPYGALAAMLGRPVSAATESRLFRACSKLGDDFGDLGDLTAICSAAMALYEISQRPPGDLAYFANRSEVAVLCNWGITSEFPSQRPVTQSFDVSFESKPEQTVE